MAMSERPRASPKEVERSIRALVAFHRQGLRSLRALPRKGTHGQGEIPAQAERLGWDLNRMHKARRFALQYGKADLEHLCSLLRQHRPVFGVSHIALLVTVASRAKREELQRLCLRRNWSTKELQANLKQRYGKRRQAGRRPHIGSDLASILTTLELAGSRWLRVFDILAEEDAGGEAKSRLAQLPGPIPRQARAARDVLATFQVTLAEKLAALREGSAAANRT